jgi:hypothetical protein
MTRTTGKKWWLSNDLFIFFKHGNPYLWDFRHHRQFEICVEDFARLFEIAKGSSLNDSSLDRTIADSGDIYLNAGA